MEDRTNVARNIHHDSDTTTSSEESFMAEESEDEFNSKL